jgi:putative PIN family toxin of toxin-antitoxin system
VIRLTLDTNVVVSGLLWNGPPARLLEFARDGRCEFFTSIALLTELRQVLQRSKFAAVLSASHLYVDDLVLEYAKLARVIHPSTIVPVVLHDPADDHVLACGQSGNVDLIVSGDSDLLSLRIHRGIMIVGPTEAVDRVSLPTSARQALACYGARQTGVSVLPRQAGIQVPSVNTSR